MKNLLFIFILIFGASSSFAEDKNALNIPDDGWSTYGHSHSSENESTNQVDPSNLPSLSSTKDTIVYSRNKDKQKDVKSKIIDDASNKVSPVIIKDSNPAEIRDSNPLSSIIKGGVNLKAEDPKFKSFITRKVYDYRDKPPPKFFQRKQYFKPNTHLPTVFYQEDYTKLLFSATDKGNIGAISNLLNKEADINGKLKPYDVTPLILACSNRYKDVIKFLVFRGANLNAQDSIGQTALHLCAKNKDYESIKFLLDNGANYNLLDSSNKTAFDYLPADQGLIFSFNYFKTQAQFNKALLDYSSKGNYLAVQLALSKGADVNVKSKDGSTPLILAIQSHQDARIIQLLLSKGANPLITDHNNATALDYATLSGNATFVELVDTYITKYELENNTSRPPSKYINLLTSVPQSDEIYQTASNDFDD